VDFRTEQAYIRLPRGDKALRSDSEGRLGIIDIYRVPSYIRAEVKYPTTWEQVEALPFVETFNKQDMVVR
jgi:hypothetical protein